MRATETHAADLALMLEASRLAADVAMRFFRRDPEVWYKNEGRSPVSEADLAVDTLLHRMLLGARPDYGWLSEESEDTQKRLSHSRVFIIDPIDGTRAYVAGLPDWCVSVGLVEDGKPVAGVLAAPARDEIWCASVGRGAFLNDVRLLTDRNDDQQTTQRVVVPDLVGKAMRPGAEAALAKVPGGPSLALRIAAVASGEYDGAYIRPRSNEWDLAAADVMLAETGHILIDQNGVPMIYNAPDPSRGILLAASLRQAPHLLGHLQPSGGH